MLSALWRGWLVVARKIGRFQSRLILTFIYFVILAPFALAVRIFSDPLGLHATASWHWLPRNEGSTTALNAVRQQF